MANILSNDLNQQVSYQDFFQAFGYGPKDEVYFRMFSDKDKNRRGLNRSVSFRYLDGILSELEKLNKEGNGVFFVVNGGGQKDKDVKIARAQFMEIDPAKEDLERVERGEITLEELLELQLQKILAFSLQPSIIIRTKKSLHCYWILSDHDLKKFKEIQERLIQYFDSDPSIKNESRVMRLYGFLHQKKDPVMVRLIKFDPNLKYTQQQFHEALPLLKKKEPAVTASNPTGDIETALKWLETAERDTSAEYVKRFLKQHNVPILKEFINNNESLVLCVPCPWRDEHTEETGVSSSAIIIFINGAIIYSCQHGHCKEKARAWKDFKEYYQEQPPDTEGFSEAVNTPPENAKGQKIDLEFFHHWKQNKEGMYIPYAVYDVRILNYLKRNNEIKILDKIPYIYNNGVFEPDPNGARLKTMIKGLIYPELIKSSNIDPVYKLFLADAELQITSDDLNKNPVYWINFKNGFYDPIKKKMIPHDVKYMSINQIPHEYNPNEQPEGKAVDEWLDFIAPDPDNKEMLLEYCGYCMTIDTRQQKFLILYGTGGSGKSTLIKLLETIIGKKNLSHVSLKNLANRFQSFPLMGKLVNSCADLEVDALKDPTTMKQISGEDSVQVEPKGVNAFPADLYAKQLFSTNEIPQILNEKSNGFFRRLMILPMNSTPKKPDRNLFLKLQNELPHFMHLCVEALERMHERGVIIESHESIEAVKRVRANSDVVQAFIDEICETGASYKIHRADLYDFFCDFCAAEGRTKLSKRGFFQALRVKNLTERKIQGVCYWLGIRCNSEALFELYEDLPSYSRSFCPYNDDQLKVELTKYKNQTSPQTGSISLAEWAEKKGIDISDWPGYKAQ